MANQFDLKKFLNENKLTRASRALNENTQTFEGRSGFFLGTVGDVKVYSLEDSSTADTMSYGIIDREGNQSTLNIDVAGEPADLAYVKGQAPGISDELANYIVDDINRELDGGM